MDIPPETFADQVEQVEADFVLVQQLQLHLIGVGAAYATCFGVEDGLSPFRAHGFRSKDGTVDLAAG